MKQSVSHYVMPDEKEEATAELVHRLGLDGIENLIYGCLLYTSDAADE